MPTPYLFPLPSITKQSVKTILVTACFIGAADGLAAILLTYSLYNRPPIIVFQYIASALLGRASFSGGFLSGLIGLIAHFFIALLWTILFFNLHPTFSFFVRNKIIKSIIYGIIIWTIMNLLVLPLSRIPSVNIDLYQALIGMAILIIAAGIPLSFIFDKFFFRTQA
ncbi:MAG: hypothetical protein ABIR06_22005 [Cyclobacteriaceae bacterium]